jgi:hypothetical protein
VFVSLFLSGFWTSPDLTSTLFTSDRTFTTLATRKTRPGTGKYEVLVERMVSSSTPAAQVSENEKKRKQAMEKIKANHVRPLLSFRLPKLTHFSQNDSCLDNYKCGCSTLG